MISLTHHHALHDHDDDPHATQDTPGATFDPVCRHWVIPGKAHGTRQAGGHEIHFCSANCVRAFDKDPARFVPIYEAQVLASAKPEAAASRPTRMGFLDKIRGSAAPAGAETDPVCHMKIDPAHAAGKSEHEGKTYHFCSAGCKQKFDADPKRFLVGGADGGHSMH